MSTQGPFGDETVMRVPDLTSQGYGLERTATDRTREILAFMLFALFAGSVIAAFVYVGSADSWERAKEFMLIAIPAEIGLLGAAVGFYFGSEAETRSRNS